MVVEIVSFLGARMPGACRRAESQRRGFRCPALAPVLEHYEAPEEEEELSLATPNSETAGARAQPTDHGNAVKKSATKLRILSKLRDGYVKLLNDVACGADYSGASSFYGCPAGGADYSAAFYARLQREAREKQAKLQAMGQGQQRTQQSRMIFTGAFA